MPKTATKAKTIEKAAWRPEACEQCAHPFSDGWESDYSMSGELVWICPKCGKVNYSPLD
jgi:RNase P subunit RPR2